MTKIIIGFKMNCNKIKMTVNLSKSVSKFKIIFNLNSESLTAKIGIIKFILYTYQSPLRLTTFNYEFFFSTVAI